MSCRPLRRTAYGGWRRVAAALALVLACAASPASSQTVRLDFANGAVVTWAPSGDPLGSFGLPDARLGSAMPEVTIDPPLAVAREPFGHDGVDSTPAPVARRVEAVPPRATLRVVLRE